MNQNVEHMNIGSSLHAFSYYNRFQLSSVEVNKSLPDLFTCLG